MLKYVITKPNFEVNSINGIRVEPNTKYKVVSFEVVGHLQKIPFSDIKYNPDEYKFDISIRIDDVRIIRLRNDSFLSINDIRRNKLKKVLWNTL